MANVLFLSFSLLLSLLSGVALYLLVKPFVRVKEAWFCKGLLLLTFAFSSSMVIWVGDPNLLFTFPVFLALFLCCTQGELTGRLTVGLIFFCLMMSVCAMADTYLRFFDAYDILCRTIRPIVFTLMYLLLRRRFPKNLVYLPKRLWNLMFGLTCMPLCALLAVVLLTYQKNDSLLVNSLAMNQGLVVLPFVCTTALMLLTAILILANHTQLEEAVRLTSLREIYYQGLRREHTQVHILRHDLRNHLSAVQGLLKQGEQQKALRYLEQLADSPGLTGTQQLCDNEIANAVLSAKLEEITQKGIPCRFSVSLPLDLPVADPDLCAMLGNALDNAIEAAERSDDPQITVSCRADKGLFMLRVENSLVGDEKSDLSTTKADPTAHGFGLAGMREIAARYHGSLSAGPVNGRFELVVCLSL